MYNEFLQVPGMLLMGLIDRKFNLTIWRKCRFYDDEEKAENSYSSIQYFPTSLKIGKNVLFYILYNTVCPMHAAMPYSTA